MMHYRSDLAKMMALDSTNQGWRCLQCSVVYSTERSMVYYLLATHNAIAEHVPTKDSFEIQPRVKSKPGGLDVETNRDRDRERP